MKITIQDHEGISQAIKRTLINENGVTANNENFDKASIWTQVMNAFHDNEAESTISHNEKTKSIGSEWSALKKNVIVYTGDVITIAEATWNKILEIFGVKEQTPDDGAPTVMNDNEQGEGSLNVEQDKKEQDIEVKEEESEAESVVEDSQGDSAGNVSQDLSTSSVEESPANTPSIVPVPATPVTEEKDAVSTGLKPVVDLESIVDNNLRTISLPDDNNKIYYTVQDGGKIDYSANNEYLQDTDTYKDFMAYFTWGTSNASGTFTLGNIMITYNPEDRDGAKAKFFEPIAKDVTIKKIIYDDLRKKQNEKVSLTKNETAFLSQFLDTLDKYGLRLNKYGKIEKIPKKK